MNPTDLQQLADSPDGYFGVCPICGRHGRDLLFRHVGREHWCCCDACRTCWHIGSNLFSAWREQTAEQHAATAAMLAGYVEVEPVTRTAPPADPDERPW